MKCPFTIAIKSVLVLTFLARVLYDIGLTSGFLEIRVVALLLGAG
jgi:hypothetical protein